MNIQAINNQTSFKAVYSPKGLHFSESQLKVIDDIKSRADEKMDFIVSSGDTKDSVELRLLVGPKTKLENGVRLNTGVYEGTRRVGIYDKNRPFVQADADQTAKQWNDDQKTFFFSLLACLALFGAMMFAVRKLQANKDTIPTVKEQVINPIKDTLQKVGKDTLDLTKQLIRK